jgi:hypothetical protein
MRVKGDATGSVVPDASRREVRWWRRVLDVLAHVDPAA